MEFTRTAVDPPWPIPRDAVPTFSDGGRCDDERFRPYEAIAGSWAGEGARLEAYRILDGCAVMAFLGAPPRKEFLFLTFVSADEVWETDVLDSSLENGLMRYRGAETWRSGALESGEELRWSVEGDRLLYQRDERRLSLTRR